MTHQEFIKPVQCNNCDVLRRRIEDYYDASDNFANSALQAGIESERAVLGAEAPLAELKAEAARTDQLLDVADFIGKSLQESLQKDMNHIGSYCPGTTDPASPEPQACNYAQSALA